MTALGRSVPGLDVDQWLADADTDAVSTVIDDAQARVSVRINSTPSFLIGKTGEQLEPVDVTSLGPGGPPFDQRAARSVTDVRLRRAIAVLALVGAGIAGYPAVVRALGEAPVCSTGGCESVQSSDYAEVVGIPVALLGLLAYLALFATALRAGPAFAAVGAGIALAPLACSTFIVQLVVTEALRPGASRATSSSLWIAPPRPRPRESAASPQARRSSSAAELPVVDLDAAGLVADPSVGEEPADRLPALGLHGERDSDRLAAFERAQSPVEDQPVAQLAGRRSGRSGLRVVRTTTRNPGSSAAPANSHIVWPAGCRSARGSARTRRARLFGSRATNSRAASTSADRGRAGCRSRSPGRRRMLARGRSSSP